MDATNQTPAASCRQKLVGDTGAMFQRDISVGCVRYIKTAQRALLWPGPGAHFNQMVACRSALASPFTLEMLMLSNKQCAQHLTHAWAFGIVEKC